MRQRTRAFSSGYIEWVYPRYPSIDVVQNYVGHKMRAAGFRNYWTIPERQLKSWQVSPEYARSGYEYGRYGRFKLRVARWDTALRRVDVVIISRHVPKSVLINDYVGVLFERIQGWRRLYTYLSNKGDGSALLSLYALCRCSIMFTTSYFQSGCPGSSTSREHYSIRGSIVALGFVSPR